MSILDNGRNHSIPFSPSKYNAYLDDLIDYTICTEEDIQAIEHYILEIEIKLYNALDGGDSNK